MSTSWHQLGSKLLKQAKSKGIPIAGQFELTSRCNLRCKMCYVSHNTSDKDVLTKELSTEQWIRLAQEARDAGMLYLLLTGGEVFVRSDFREIYEAISKMGFNIEIYTNATMISPDTVKWISQMPPSSMGVTMYGASPQTYKRVCGNPKAYRQAVRGIELLQSAGIPLWLKMTVIRDNIEDFYKVADFAQKHNLQLNIVNYISPRRDGCSNSPQNVRLSAKDLLKFERSANQYLKEHQNITAKLPDTNDCYLQDESSANEAENNLDDNDSSSFLCTAGKCAFWMTWDGKMTPCSLLCSPPSYPLNVGFKHAWKQLQMSCSSVPSSVECSKCPLKGYCLVCPGRLKIETGFFDKPAPYLCQLAQCRKEIYDNY